MSSMLVLIPIIIVVIVVGGGGIVIYSYVIFYQISILFCMYIYVYT
jgi:hypothetical protein